MQARVDLVRAARTREREEPVVVLAAAERAWPVAGRERGRLVEEEQLREAAGLKERVTLPAAELESAGDPALGRPPPPDLPVRVVQAAAVAVDEPARGVGDQVAERVTRF